MLGGFRMVYQDRQINLGKSRYNKMQQLLLYLIYNRQEGVRREQLMELLYADVDTETASNAFRAGMHRLRKRLIDAGLPNGEYVSAKDGLYRWQADHLTLVLDVEEFEKQAMEALEHAEDESRIAMLEQACRLYTGEFLPMMIADDWVAVASRKYQELYFKCLRTLTAQLKAKNKNAELLPYYEQCLSRYPYEEWQLAKMECLAEMKNYKQAITYYEQIEREYQKEFGRLPSEALSSCYRRIRKQMRNEMDSIESIQIYLESEMSTRGATRYDYLTFIDIYRYILLILRCTEDDACLVMFTIVDEKNVPVEPSDTLEELGQILEQAICSNARKSDLYTRYGKNQFLLLLVGSNLNGCKIVADRIRKSYRSMVHRRSMDVYFVFKSIMSIPDHIEDDGEAANKIAQLKGLYQPDDHPEAGRRRLDRPEK
jgi:DNA-binding SARP family transcriptional activator